MATLRKNDNNSYVAMAKQLMIAIEPFASVNTAAKLSWDNSPTLRDFAGNTFDSQVRWLQQKFGLAVDGIIGPKSAWWIRNAVGATTSADMLYRYIAGKTWSAADRPVATTTKTTTAAVNKVVIPATTTALPIQSIVQAPTTAPKASNNGVIWMGLAAVAAYFMWG